MARLARRTAAVGVDLVQSAFLGTAMGEGQDRIAPSPTPQDYTMDAIMWSESGAGANIGLAKRKFDTMASTRGQS